MSVATSSVVMLPSLLRPSSRESLFVKTKVRVGLAIIEGGESCPRMKEQSLRHKCHYCVSIISCYCGCNVSISQRDGNIAIVQSLMKVT